MSQAEEERLSEVFDPVQVFQAKGIVMSASKKIKAKVKRKRTASKEDRRLSMTDTPYRRDSRRKIRETTLQRDSEKD